MRGQDSAVRALREQVRDIIHRDKHSNNHLNKHMYPLRVCPLQVNSKLEVMTGYGTDREKARQLKRVFRRFDDDGSGDINMGDTYSHNLGHTHTHR
jgi:hypothetical protein